MTIWGEAPDKSLERIVRDKVPETKRRRAAAQLNLYVVLKNQALKLNEVE